MYIIGRIILRSSIAQKDFMLPKCNILVLHSSLYKSIKTDSHCTFINPNNTNHLHVAFYLIFTFLPVEFNEIRDALKDPELQKMVFKIDGSLEPEKVILHSCDNC